MSTVDDSLTPDDFQFENVEPITISDDLESPATTESATPKKVKKTEKSVEAEVERAEKAPTPARFGRPASAPKMEAETAPVEAEMTVTSEPAEQAPTVAVAPESRYGSAEDRTGTYIEMDQNADMGLSEAPFRAPESAPRRAPASRMGGAPRYNNGPRRNAPAYRNGGTPAPRMNTQSEPGYDDNYIDRRDMPLEERIQEDMKNSFPGKGILEVTPSGFGFLRPKFTPSNDDIYVSQSQIRKFWLRPGDEVDGLVRPPKENEKYHGLLKIEKVNGRAMSEEECRNRNNFDEMTSMYPDKQIKLETEPEILSTRIMDLFAPIGFGQRGMIVSPPKAGKTTLLKNLATGIIKNFPDAHLIAILIGERPEEVTDMTRSIGAEVVSSHFDQSPRDQIRAAEIGLERAKRLVEEGKDVIILLDSITRLARAYNMAVNPSGRTLSGGFDPAALYPAKKFLGAARNCEEGGSLTIIGTALVNTESRMDDLIYEEFKGTGNMELVLDRSYAEKRIFPAIDIERSGTRHDELLISPEKLDKIAVLRRMMGLLDKDERITVLTDKMKKTKSNEEFLDEISKGAK